MANGLGAVAGGSVTAIFAAISAAVLFGAMHALMPGHGKTVLISYHLGRPSKLWDGFGNGVILALTHVGLAVILVLAGFAVISKVFAFGGRTPQFEVASGMLITLIGAFLTMAVGPSQRSRAFDRRANAGIRHGHDPMPSNDLRHELCAGERNDRSGFSHHGRYGTRHDRDYRRFCARGSLRP
jgi:ABC-type nickel/cobalt efflux system permease component RcnA